MYIVAILLQYFITERENSALKDRREVIYRAFTNKRGQC